MKGPRVIANKMEWTHSQRIKALKAKKSLKGRSASRAPVFGSKVPVSLAGLRKHSKLGSAGLESKRQSAALWKALDKQADQYIAAKNLDKAIAALKAANSVAGLSAGFLVVNPSAIEALDEDSKQSVVGVVDTSSVAAAMATGVADHDVSDECACFFCDCLKY